MVAPNTTSAPPEAGDVVLDLTDEHIDRFIEVAPNEYRWDCGQCAGRSIGTYDGIAAAWEGLKRHNEAIRPEVHRA